MTPRGLLARANHDVAPRAYTLPLPSAPSPSSTAMSDGDSRSSPLSLEGDSDYFPRLFLDPVHEYISVDPLTSAIIDTPQFQRLRYLAQLGTSYFVFPGASHNRFEHCLGVYHLAGKMVESLRDKQPSLGITDRDVQCVRLAGLCHDLGHGPFSHVFDNQFIPRVRPDIKWSHEEASVMMLDALVQENDIPIEKDWVNFIKDLILGEPQYTVSHDPPEKPYLFEIVANKKNSIDVDKFDYIARDTMNCGNRTSSEATRLIHSSRVINNEVVYGWKEWYTVHSLFNTRYSLHKRIYNHPVAKGIEYMVVDVLALADPILKISEKIYQPSKYLHLTDSILEEIERSELPELEQARAIIRRLRKRDLYKMVDQKVLPREYRALWKDDLTAERIAEVSKTLPGSEVGGGMTLCVDDVIVDFTGLHFGMKEKNPLDYVRFYEKRKPNEAHSARPDEASHLIPAEFEEVTIRCYTRNPQKFGLAQAAFRKVVETLPETPPSPPDTAIGDPQTPPSLASPRAKPHSHSPLGNGVPSGTKTRSLRRSSSGTLFSATQSNQFTTVPPGYQHHSPSPLVAPQASLKRARGGDESPTRRGSPPKRRR
ncbi:hypothetical protein BOTBODRAFT_38548 [Botryobasidium botryosum FD-172 SS1]|uniref:HD domain-containing protein n=1 Tax=Botryobasidium botryosum (strain FD-172 SS1) TaxID=930990 RepID=A0A067LWL0_BOTB1|nr:hypothetical protein BOTBODRAFT_38548 [Botryobasidium botryosum FD-172 SS1]